VRALVAGCGYVGSVLAVRLAASGHEVYALSRGGVTIDGVVSVVADLTEPSTLVVPDVDVAFFTAAPDRSDEVAYRAIYVNGSRNLKNALPASTKLVFTSSTAVYGQDDGSEVDESSPTTPTSFRGHVLLEAESVADTVVRLAGIYGPGRARPLERLRRGEARYTPGRYLNFVHRDDAAGALEHVMMLERPEPVYIGVDEEPVDSEIFFRWLAEQAQMPPPPPDGTRAGKNKRCSSARLVASGFVFRYPTFRDGYRALVSSQSRRLLAPCPSSPNCVSSRAVEDDARHSMPALVFEGSPDDARDAIVETMRFFGGRVVLEEVDYVRAEFVSRIFGFVDDVEWVIDAAAARADFRSASRVGYSDLGTNRRRMRKIVRRLIEKKKKFSEYAGN